MKLFKRILKKETGQALPIALILLVLGGLLVVPTLGLVSTSLNANRQVDTRNLELYAADAGVESILWNVRYNQQNFPLPANGNQTALPLFNLDGRAVNANISNQANLYTITSVSTSPDGHVTTIVCSLDIVSGGGAVFNYAITALNGPITLSGSSDTTSGPTLNDGDVYANGNISLIGSAKINGDATSTGQVTTQGSSTVTGTSTQQAQPIVPPTAQMNAIIASTLATAQNVNCTSCAAYTYTGTTWSPPAGTYYGAQNAKYNMTIGGSGTWIFNDPVCVGVDTNSNLTINGSASVTFKGPVKVGGTLTVNTSGTVIFGDQTSDTVCTGRGLTIGSSGSVTFSGPVYVGYNSASDLNVSGSGTTAFSSTLYVSGNVDISGSHTIPLGGAVYVAGNIDMSGSNGLSGGQDIVAVGDITVAGSNQQLPAADIPFLISTTGDVGFSGSNWTSALIYAPEGTITMSGSNRLYGSAVGESVNLSGSVVIEYPSDLKNLQNLPGQGNNPAGLQIHTYNIQ